LVPGSFKTIIQTDMPRFATPVRNRADALVVGGNSFSPAVPAAPAYHFGRCATPFPPSTMVEISWKARGLMGFGTNMTEVYRQLGDYTGRILNSAKPLASRPAPGMKMVIR
jgi:hypothetical protein